MDKYSKEEIENIILLYEKSHGFSINTEPVKKKKCRKPIEKIPCEICCIEISRSGFTSHQKSKKHVFLQDIRNTSKELKKRLEEVKTKVKDDLFEM